MRLHLRTDHDRGMVLVDLLSEWIISKHLGMFDIVDMQAGGLRHRSISEGSEVEDGRFTRRATFTASSSPILISHMR